MRSKTEAKLYQVKNRNGSITYRVDLGKSTNGKRATRGFSTLEAAQEFKQKVDTQLATKASPTVLADLSQAEKYDILAATELLKPYNASVRETVDFFIKHNAANRIVLTVEEALEAWKAEKSKLRMSQKYQNSAVRNFFRPFVKKFKKRKLHEISAKEIENYIFKHRTWSGQTKASHIGYIRTFFNYFIKQGNISLNPATNIAKPKVVKDEPRLLSISDTTRMLDFALANGFKEECAAMVLVLFCAIRVDEVDRLTWDSIDWEKSKVTVQGKQSKKGHRRTNPIPANALRWLESCTPDDKLSRIGPSDYIQRMKRLRSKIKENYKDFNYPQNAMRHSFSGYHLAKHENSILTAFLLGHPNPNLLYSTYKELASKEDAELYWNIIPKQLADDIAAQKAKDTATEQALINKALSQRAALG